jgi:hypothetical protein
VRTAIADGRRDDALTYFMRLTGTSADDVAAMRQAPFWSAPAAVAHTLPYDAACLGDGRPPYERLARITRPTLVPTGGGAGEPDAAEWVVALDPAAEAIVDTVPDAERRILGGQGHVVDPQVMASELRRFFGPSRADVIALVAGERHRRSGTLT